MRVFLACVCALSMAAIGCGDDGGALTDAGPLRDGDGSLIDGDGSVIPPPLDFGDGGPIDVGECSAEGAECNNCIDDDGDGNIDGLDLECISPLDDDEGSFATGIPGDNKSNSGYQDCFFDGNSGSGNDGCRIHNCCITGPDSCTDNKFKPATDCVATQQCLDNCVQLTAPGCDCFGCCTLCDEAGCYDIVINPDLWPPGTDCSDTNLAGCPTCQKNDECAQGDCSDPGDCVLCPGENPENLPAECMGEPVCPDGQDGNPLQSCIQNEDCAGGEYCNSGCCNEGFIVQ